MDMPISADAGAGTPADQRPAGCQQVVLVLQGGGALGAYQGGVYQAMHEARLEPDWVTGVSIGAINAAIVAGNPPGRRLERLRQFWNTITDRGWPFTPEADASLVGDGIRRASNLYSSWLTLTQGQPGFFSVNPMPPPLAMPGSQQATSMYDSAPLRETLLRVVDFDLLNRRTTRLAIGAVNVASGNFAYFDNADIEITPEHVMASGALPPALAMVRIGDDLFWDGALVSNTPLSHLLDNVSDRNSLVFQVDLFSARGPVPRDMDGVMSRQKDILQSSRTRLVTDFYKSQHKMQLQLRSLLGRLPERQLTVADRTLRERLAHLPEVAILLLIYQQAAYEGGAKDFEFSRRSMREHWAAGYRDTQATLRHRDWLAMPGADAGIVVHDVHRDEN